MGTDPQVARLDPAFGLANLFRPLLRGRKRQKLDVEQVFDGARLRWRGPDQLDIGDQAVLLALVALACAQPCGSGGMPLETLPPELHNGLALTGEWPDESTVLVRATWYELAKWSGHRSNRTADVVRQMRDSVQRLTEVTLWVERHGRNKSARVVAKAATDRRTFSVAFNPRLAAAVVGQQYARILLSERNALNGDVAKALHTFFSASIRPGGSFKYRLASLETHVWGNEALGPTRRSRHHRLRAALGDITTTLEWGAARHEDVYTVTRPAISAFVETGTPLRGNGNASSWNRECSDGSIPNAGAGLATSSPRLLGSYKNLQGDRRRRDGAPAQLRPRHAPPLGGVEGAPGTC